MTICTHCGLTNDRYPQRYCSACHAEYQAQWRLKQKRIVRHASRITAAKSVRKGRIKKEACQVCGSPKSEMHHPDHEMPEFVIWLCREHHAAWHRHWRHAALNVFIEWLEVARACDDVRRSEERKAG